MSGLSEDAYASTLLFLWIYSGQIYLPYFICNVWDCFWFAAVQEVWYGNAALHVCSWDPHRNASVYHRVGSEIYFHLVFISHPSTGEPQWRSRSPGIGLHLQVVSNNLWKVDISLSLLQISECYQPWTPWYNAGGICIVYIVNSNRNLAERISCVLYGCITWQLKSLLLRQEIEVGHLKGERILE